MKFAVVKFTFAFLVMVTIAIRLRILNLSTSSFSQQVNASFFLMAFIETIPNATSSEISSKPNAKPKLILHVGPQKTATTTIQFLVQEESKALQKDNYKVIDFNFRQIGVVFNDCFGVQNDCGMWDELTNRFDEAFANSYNIISINEELSNLPVNNKFRKRIIL